MGSRLVSCFNYHNGVRSCFLLKLPSRASVVSGGESPSRPDCSIPQPSQVRTRCETGSGVDSCLDSSTRPSLDLGYRPKRSRGQESRPDPSSRLTLLLVLRAIDRSLASSSRATNLIRRRFSIHRGLGQADRPDRPPINSNARHNRSGDPRPFVAAYFWANEIC